MDFFAKHAPEVLKYRTAAEIEALAKPIDAIDFSGTLGAFEKFNENSWFDSGEAKQFYLDYLRIRNLIDGYLRERKIPTGHLLIFVKSFAKGFTPTVWVGNIETKEAISLTNFSDESIDLTKYTVVRGQRVSGRWDLATSKMVADLYDEMVSLFEGPSSFRRCPACGALFIPLSKKGRKEVYHNKRCYWRENKRRYRSRKK
jgi:hypothetical protein